MDASAQARLDKLRDDFREVTGKDFRHFFCPITFRDEPGDLCKGHIVNSAFAGAPNDWTIQRADVDNFYGRCFEPEFIDLQHAGVVGADGYLVDKRLASRFQPKILLRGEPVAYYHSRTGATPPGQSNLLLETSYGKVDLRLKLTPAEIEATETADWEIRVEKDMRLPALISLLKTGYLTLFHLLGYRYALSASGQFLGPAVLGKFFTAQRDQIKASVLEAAASYFNEYENLVRPFRTHSPILAGTVSDKRLYICETIAGIPWAFLVIVRTPGPLSLHAVLLPIFEHADAAAHFVKFMKDDGGVLLARFTTFVGGSEFQAHTKLTRFEWPARGSATGMIGDATAMLQ